MPAKRTYPRTQRICVVLLLLGDVGFCFLGLCAGYWVRFVSPLRHIGLGAEAQPGLREYSPLLFLGTLFLIGTYTNLNLYDSRLLLRPHRSVSVILRGTFLWFLIFLGTSLILKFQPSVSRIFVALSCITTLGVMACWRFAFYHLLSRSPWSRRIIQRVVIVGWSKDADQLAQAIHRDQNHAYEFCGTIATGNRPPSPAATGPSALGDLAELESILELNLIDIAVVADLDLTREQIAELAQLCERKYVAFKVIASFFQIFVSNLRLQTISGVPILGVEAIPSQSLINRFIKRTTDLLGAVVGLAASAPIVLIFAYLIKRESPGPALYRQRRVGLDGKAFTIYKLRSMRPDAERETGAQWAKPGDNRRLKVGAFLREWNLDELPQFWNVLIGNMSLVGPRPERPELIAQFEREIPHYNSRHEMRPGITGWAQVNGLRGDTSLVERIRYDLYYIENWSLWFDIQILLLTFLRRDNAY
jgi:exopolysaccharide biosynthesis polyprenyl glycosylphosphotransferase